MNSVPDAGCSTRAEVPEAVDIAEVRDEDQSADHQIRTFFFDRHLGALPGQFVQVWLPGVDEKPLSISYQTDDRAGFTVAKVGPFTERLFECQPGDLIGVRGPYGNSFDIGHEGRIVIVSGGCGCAPTALLAEEAKRRGLDVTYVIGARTRDLLIFEDRMMGQGIETVVATDDGTAGVHGFPTDILAGLLTQTSVDRVYGCGPEVMLKKVFDICQETDVPCQLSLERYMKCAIGVCGACALDGTGWLVCKDGPVFDEKELAQVTEFGAYRRDAAGRVVAL